MIRRMTAAAVVAIMLAAPGMAFAAGPDDKETIWTILSTIAKHSCEGASHVAEAWGLKGWPCKPSK
jgi:hypothetical protein